MLLWGAAAFGLASVFCAFSQSASSSSWGRALLGVAGATIAPSTMSLIFNMFQREDERTRAIGVWGTAFAVGGTVGPVIGGLLLNWFHWDQCSWSMCRSWRPCWCWHAPAAGIPHDQPHARLDLMSVALSLATVLPVVYALKSIAAYGTSVQDFAFLLAGLAFGFLFWRRQHRIDHPLVGFRAVPLQPLQHRADSQSRWYLFHLRHLHVPEPVHAIGVGVERTGGWPVECGAIPGILCHVALVIQGDQQDRAGEKRDLGLAVYAMGAALMAWSASALSLYGVLGSSMVMALGFVPVVLTTTNLIVSSAPPERAGSASAISETSSEFGGALGIAVLGSVATYVYRATWQQAMPRWPQKPR